MSYSSSGVAIRHLRLPSLSKTRTALAGSVAGLAGAGAGAGSAALGGCLFGDVPKGRNEGLNPFGRVNRLLTHRQQVDDAGREAMTMTFGGRCGYGIDFDLDTFENG